MSQASPPPYLLPPLSEASAPNYSPRPLRGEQSLCYRPGHDLEQATASDVNDVFVHPFNDSLAILLERQSKNISIPTYAKCGKISGNLLLEPHLAETVTLVVLEVRLFMMGIQLESNENCRSMVSSRLTSLMRMTI